MFLRNPQFANRLPNRSSLIRSQPLDGATKYPGRDVGQTFVRRDEIMTQKGLARAAPTNLRKETRDWLTEKTIPTVREIARDLESAGEDVRDLIEAIDELEMILRDGPRRNGFVRP